MPAHDLAGDGLPQPSAGDASSDPALAVTTALLAPPAGRRTT
jgi:hypothetical protein